MQNVSSFDQVSVYSPVNICIPHEIRYQLQNNNFSEQHEINEFSMKAAPGIFIQFSFYIGHTVSGYHEY